MTTGPIGPATGPVKEPADVSRLRFGADGLLPAVVQQAGTGRVLMVGYMNAEALEKTLKTGRTWFYSRSRQRLWQKGESSGHYQLVRSVTVDCDGDALLVEVEQLGPGTCHEGYVSCFHRPLHPPDARLQAAAAAGGLPPAAAPPDFDPQEVYAEPLGGEVLSELFETILQRKLQTPEGSYTAYLFREGTDKILKKVGEEAAEVIIAAKGPVRPGGEADRPPLVREAADLIYHLLVLFAQTGVSLQEVYRELNRRRARGGVDAAPKAPGFRKGR